LLVVPSHWSRLPGRGGRLPGLGELVDWQIAQGTQNLSPVGTTGESPTLSHEEHERVIAAVIERAAGRAKSCPGPLECNLRSHPPDRVCGPSRADGALIVAPYYNRPTQEGLFAHFAKIAESVISP